MVELISRWKYLSLTLMSVFVVWAMASVFSIANIVTPAYAIIPTCDNCSIHGDGSGTMTIPDNSAIIPCFCDLCHADITFDATQNGKNAVIGKFTIQLIADGGDPHTITGDIGTGKISEKQFVLKGLVETTGEHFTINGQVGKGTINFQADDGTEGTFSGTVTVTVTE